MSDLLALPEPLRGLLKWMMRQGQVNFADVTAFLDQDEEHTRILLASLRDRGFVRATEICGLTHYAVRLGARRGRALPSHLWQALEGKAEHEGEEHW